MRNTSVIFLILIAYGFPSHATPIAAGKALGHLTCGITNYVETLDAAGILHSSKGSEKTFTKVYLSQGADDSLPEELTATLGGYSINVEVNLDASQITGIQVYKGHAWIEEAMPNNHGSFISFHPGDGTSAAVQCRIGKD
jgi:hypothetical protein